VDAQRFLVAQEPVYMQVLQELCKGEKTSHWMWFVFPQLRSLGRSDTALFYGLDSVADAALYLAHPVLGERLKACTEAVLQHQEKSAHAIFHSPDDLKFRSCMTLFHLAAPQEPLFEAALAHFFGGKEDQLTLQWLG
jgi:uncharacterized protein (DUF1810 family)